MVDLKNDVDKDAFREACKPLWDDYQSQFGDEIINKIQRIEY